jgi:hypothetical protein
MKFKLSANKKLRASLYFGGKSLNLAKNYGPPKLQLPHLTLSLDVDLPKRILLLKYNSGIT